MNRFVRKSGQRTMTREQVRGFDDWAISQMGVPGVVLMENAGRGCADVVEERLRQKGGKKAVILCGTGNNGGDGYVVARHLLGRGCEAKVVIVGDMEKVGGDARINLDILLKMDLEPQTLDLSSTDLQGELERSCAGCDILVDAVFGTGLRGPLRDEYVRLVEAVNALGTEVLAVDIPSGLDCDTGRPLPAAVQAAATVTFAAAKRGFEYESSAQYAGEVFVASIGIEPRV